MRSIFMAVLLERKKIIISESESERSAQRWKNYRRHRPHGIIIIILFVLRRMVNNETILVSTHNRQ